MGGSVGPPLPELDLDNRAFWTGGASGQLLITRCQGCGTWLHPPRPACRVCHGTDVVPTAAAGTGIVVTYTVNLQAWVPDLEVPSVFAIVELDEQPGLRLTTRLVAVDPADVRIGMRVRVRFEQVEDVWLPLFAPEDAPR
jgi:uncharacterized protein